MQICGRGALPAVRADTAIRAVDESSVTNSDAEKRLDARGIGEAWTNVIKPGERRYYEKFRAHEEGDGEDVPGGA